MYVTPKVVNFEIETADHRKFTAGLDYNTGRGVLLPHDPSKAGQNISFEFDPGTTIEKPLDYVRQAAVFGAGRDQTLEALAS